MTPEEQAAADAAQDKQIRDLATQITQMSKLGFDPLTVRKGIVAAVSDTTNPPTVSINISGDTDTLVSQVRTLNNYTPLVGQTVLVGKQGTEIFLLGAISSGLANTSTPSFTDTGWTKATLSNGTHGGNSNGDVMYRRILDHGSWKMQWQGGWAPGGSTTMIGASEVLDTDFRPAVKRSITVARDISSGAVTAQLDFNISGQVTLVGGTTVPSVGLNIASVSLSYSGGTDGQLFGYLSSAGSDLGHYHGCSGSTSSHVHSGSTATASVSAPTWVSLNGVEYFL